MNEKVFLVAAVMLLAILIAGTASAQAVVPVLTAITVTPTAGSVVAGTTLQLTASALDQTGVALVTQPVLTWTSSNAAIATVSATGLITGVAAGGPVTITVASGAISGFATVTVTPVQVFSAIWISPYPVWLKAGATQQFTAVAVDQTGVSMATQPAFTWSSSNTAVARVSATGLVTGVSAGSVTIRAVSGAISKSNTVTITSPTFTSIKVTPIYPTILLGATKQFTAVAVDQTGVPITPQPTFTWSTNNRFIPVSSTGLVTGAIRTGIYRPVTIYATAGGRYGFGYMFIK